MLTSYLAGKRLPPFISPLSGRFFPLPGQEYSLVAFLLPSPIAFYAINALELLLAAWLLVSLGKIAISAPDSILPYLSAVLVMLNPGFTEAWLRLLVTERSEFVLLGLFLLCFIKLHETQKNVFFAPCLIASIGALFCKETIFILVGGIGIFHLCLNRGSTTRSRFLDTGLITLSCLWLAIYYQLVYRHRGTNLYTAKNTHLLDALLHTLASNILHDAWLILCLLILLGARLNQVIRTHKVEPVLDSILLSCFFFYFAYLVLRMSNIYYLLPLYIFVPYAVVRVASNPSLKKHFRPALLVVLSVLFISQLASGMREVLTWKFAPANFQAALKAISKQIANSPNKLNVFLSGSSRGSGIELYTNLGTYLTYTGLHSNQFDIRSDTPIDDPIPFRNTLLGTTICPYSYCNPLESDEPSKGDYILLTPYDSIYKRSAFGDLTRYQLVFKTGTPIAPDLSIKALAAQLLPRRMKDTASGNIDTNFYLYKVL